MIGALLPFLLLGALPTPATPRRPDPVLTPEQEDLAQDALRAARDAGDPVSHIVVSQTRDGEVTRIEVAERVVWARPSRAQEPVASADRLTLPPPPAPRPPVRDTPTPAALAATARRQRRADRYARELAAGGWRTGRTPT